MNKILRIIKDVEKIVFAIGMLGVVIHSVVKFLIFLLFS